MTSILKVDTIQDADGNNIINESSNTITIGASGDTTNIVGTLQNNGSAVGGTNTPYFFGRLASNLDLSRNVLTKVTGMTGDELDSATAFDGTTFTVPSGQGGKYFIGSQVWIDFADEGYDGESLEAKIRINGGSYKLNGQNTVGGSGNQDMYRNIVTIHGILDLSASDYLELYVTAYDGDGGGGGTLFTTTNFFGYKIIE